MRPTESDQKQHVTTKLTLSSHEREDLVSWISEVLRHAYFARDHVEPLVQKLEENLQSFAEEDQVEIAGFTKQLTKILRDQTSDVHFFVGYRNPEKQTAIQSKEKDTPQQNNYGFEQVEVLVGNIGYIRMNGFTAGDEAFEKAGSVLQQVKDVDALIFDISRNGGGDGRMGAYLNAHLFKSKDYQDALRKRCVGEKDWYRSEEVYNDVPGPFFHDIPIYVMVSESTGSAAEYFALILQVMGRATVIGQTTAGAGNPITMAVHGNFMMFVPICQIETKDGESIEARGVIPDRPFTTDDWKEETRSLAAQAIKDSAN